MWRLILTIMIAALFVGSVSAQSRGVRRDELKAEQTASSKKVELERSRTAERKRDTSRRKAVRDQQRDSGQVDRAKNTSTRTRQRAERRQRADRKERAQQTRRSERKQQVERRQRTDRKARTERKQRVDRKERAERRERVDRRQEGERVRQRAERSRRRANALERDRVEQHQPRHQKPRHQKPRHHKPRHYKPNDHRYGYRYDRHYRPNWRHRRWRQYNRSHYYWRPYHPRRYYYTSGPAFGFYLHLPVARWYYKPPHRRYVYQQVLTTTRYGQYDETAGLDIRTSFERKVKSIRDDRIEIEFEIKAVEIWDNGRFVGAIDRIPKRLRRVKAKVFNDGFVDFDRMVYIIGDQASGFEVVSLRYSGVSPDAPYDQLDVRAGTVDLLRREVFSVDYSYLLLSEERDYFPSPLVPNEQQAGFEHVLNGNDGRFSYRHTLGGLSSETDPVVTREISIY